MANLSGGAIVILTAIYLCGIVKYILKYYISGKLQKNLHFFTSNYPQVTRVMCEADGTHHSVSEQKNERNYIFVKRAYRVRFMTTSYLCNETYG